MKSEKNVEYFTKVKKQIIFYTIRDDGSQLYMIIVATVFKIFSQFFFYLVYYCHEGIVKFFSYDFGGSSCMMFLGKRPL